MSDKSFVLDNIMTSIKEKNSDLFSEPVTYAPVKGDVVDEML